MMSGYNSYRANAIWFWGPLYLMPQWRSYYAAPDLGCKMLNYYKDEYNLVIYKRLKGIDQAFIFHIYILKQHYPNSHKKQL